MNTNRVETMLATILGVIAVLGMLVFAFAAILFDALLYAHGGDGTHHLEIVEVLPYFFWFSVCFSLLLGRRTVAMVICSPRSLCWAAAGAILGRAMFYAVAGDLVTRDDSQQLLSPNVVYAAAHVLTCMCALMGAAAGVAMAQLLPARLLPAWFYRRSRE